ncbi:hypothetical protein BC628DRAFT_1416998 [Trametes gibbosa]|nr:hypothetical protein BC628DRAFT_1408745 [Trametes gibbosa]KAI0829233.1 hypothetical protein BC628DRAFT_1416998 [Trametes gibbosa]
MPAFPKVIHNGLHFNLHVQVDPVTGEATRSWSWEKEQVWSRDWHLAIPKAKSSGEKFPMVPSPRTPASANPFGPAPYSPAPSEVLAPRDTPEIGTRYCQQLHAIVPEHLAYKIGKLAPAQKPLRERFLTREFWHLPFAGEDGEKGEADVSENSVGIEIKIVPARDGTTVLAEGLTYHQAALVPIREAQKDMAIKYRSLTTQRTDLVEHAAAQQVNAIKYRTAIGH